jgi:predicted DNA repair protein MutK
VERLANPAVDPVALEKGKIKGAIRTDFILSAEIVVISLGTVAEASFGRQLGVLVAISLLMTVGVYGLVAGIVKLDDAGLYLSRQAGARAAFGRGILVAAPLLMKALGVIGTAAMFLVGGGIVVHGVPPLEHFIHNLEASAGSVGFLVPTLASGLVGILVGAVVLAVVSMVKKVAFSSKKAAG